MWWSKRHNFIDESLHAVFAAGGDPWADACALQGEVVRVAPGRRTLRFVSDGRTYYMKQHFGVGWGEIFKNWLSGKRPVLSAVNEWYAARRLENVDLPSLKIRAFWREGISPARLRSFVVSEAIENVVDLDTVLRQWGWQLPSSAVRRNLLVAVAGLTRTLFAAGVRHRDYYLCHLLAPAAWVERPEGVPRLQLLDLHRACCSERLSTHQRVRELGALYYSALDLQLSTADKVRFGRVLAGDSWAQERGRLSGLWRRIEARALRIKGREKH